MIPHYLVFALNQQVIGYNLSRPSVIENKPVIHVVSTAVLPEYQQQGIGKRLREKMKKYARNLGCKAILGYRLFSEEQESLFIQKGIDFKVVKNYYGNKVDGLMYFEKI